MTTQTITVLPGVPSDLIGWTWESRDLDLDTREYRLHSPERSWATKWYRVTDKAVAEAKRRILSEPKKAEIVAVEAAPPLLSAPLEDLARQYVQARRRNGESLLEMAACLAKAKEQANYGEWKIWLDATQTSQEAARRLANIHRRAE